MGRELVRRGRLDAPGGDPDAVWALVSERGSTVHPLGDLDGDGLADLAVGTPYDDDWQGEIIGASRGAVHLLFGHESLFDRIEDTAYARGVSLVGGVGAGYATFQPGSEGSVAGLDFNGDGTRDVLMGAIPGGDASGGILAVLEGPHAPEDADRPFNDSIDVGWVGTSGRAMLGQSVTAGDLNGDGYDDAVTTEQLVGGATYVFFGDASLAGTHSAWDDRDVLVWGSGTGAMGTSGSTRRSRTWTRTARRTSSSWTPGPPTAPARGPWASWT